MPVAKQTSAETRCDSAIAKLYGVSAIVRFGRKDRRAPNTMGVPDRLYFCGSKMVWFEVKNGRDVLSVAQTAFLTKVLAADGIAGCGVLTDLLALLNAPTPYLTGHAQIAKYRTAAGRS